MKFFIDTANIDEIKKALDMGMVDGVATNPSLIARENKPFEEIITDITRLANEEPDYWTLILAKQNKKQ